MNGADVVVVGAGPAGLAVGAQLRRVGIPAVLLERSDHIAPAWRTRYDRLRLNTPRWTSKLPGSRYAPGTPLFPSRDEMIAYLEDYAARHELDVRFGTAVERIDREDSSLKVTTSDGALTAPHVVVATGLQHEPLLPDWSGQDRFGGEVLHASRYRNPEPFRDRDVLVVGPGCSGMEIAYDLSQSAAKSVRLSVRSAPNILLRSLGGLPNDIPAMAMTRLPSRVVDAQIGVIRRVALGDLSAYGLPRPQEGPMTLLRRDGKTPAIVDREMIEAIKAGRIEVVPAVTGFDETGVHLADGTRLEPDAVIAATGYGTGLQRLVGHLDVLDERGMPRVAGGDEAAPGLRFVGFVPGPAQIRVMGAEARRAVKGIARNARQPATT